MGDLLDKIQADLQGALKARQATRLDALRLLKSELQYEMNKTGQRDLADEKVLAVIKTAVKKRKDSIVEFEKAGRQDMADKEKAELAILDPYLPAELPEAEIIKVIEEIMAKVKPQGPSDTGKVMGQVMGRLKGQNVDGALVKKLVQERF